MTNKTAEALLSRMTKLPVSEIEKIAEQVRANHKTLEGCAGPHDFQCMRPEQPFGADWKCALCGGTVNGVARSWYAKGLQHALATVSRH